MIFIKEAIWVVIAASEIMVKTTASTSFVFASENLMAISEAITAFGYWKGILLDLS